VLPGNLHIVHRLRCKFKIFFHMKDIFLHRNQAQEILYHPYFQLSAGIFVA
jgi:hypothetical protein